MLSNTIYINIKAYVKYNIPYDNNMFSYSMSRITTEFKNLVKFASFPLKLVFGQTS